MTALRCPNYQHVRQKILEDQQKDEEPQKFMRFVNPPLDLLWQTIRDKDCDNRNLASLLKL